MRKKKKIANFANFANFANIGRVRRRGAARARPRPGREEAAEAGGRRLALGELRRARQARAAWGP